MLCIFQQVTMIQFYDESGLESINSKANWVCYVTVIIKILLIAIFFFNVNIPHLFNRQTQKYNKLYLSNFFSLNLVIQRKLTFTIVNINCLQCRIKSTFFGNVYPKWNHLKTAIAFSMFLRKCRKSCVSLRSNECNGAQVAETIMAISLYH